MRNRLFFVVSGEHRTLPHAEIRAILQASRISFKETAASQKLVRLEADHSALHAVATRSMMYEQCGIEIAKTRPSRERLVSLVQGLDVSPHFAKKRSYAVRSLRIGGAFKQFQRATLEREIGEALRRKRRGIKVDLDHPDVTFLCIIYPQGFLLGEVTHSRVPGLIASRRPRKRPVFHPSTMPPKLARCVVNLARPPAGAVVLDPFCGVGGILLEAVAVGCRAVGADADLRMVKGARVNLRHYGAEPFGLIVEDATKMPVRSVQSIVTDPPYGREASTRGRRLDALLREFLPAAHSVLSRGGFLCICCPSDLRLSRIAKATGFELVESHMIYVHRSLTRRILVLSKK
ncbi:DNA methyltransferase [[Eubacterium] cellulosolvens]